ncbi:MAG TPA: dTDP-4-dehydrorhamnose 3,5-epimerase [Chloroflexi bacterium]|jgi:dTDP-4-dehydrorhamnose 3,5-epimerase|nr:dTDP-4-dehydrorhamnose 3,5-epimerase [Chloroflexota bacterium]HAL26171.1 dTDP-4-dehydrorhamnose 3,5-epimerase [Chloroflexota bacterium]
MIAGVRVRSLQRHVDDRGSLTELLRADWPEFTRFGQAIITVNRPGVIRGWHWHDRQTDVIVVVEGRAKVPLYDGRSGSSTYGHVNEYVCGGDELKAIFVPPGVWHGYKTVSPESAIIVNFPDQVYDAAHPDENRAPYDAPGVPYDWTA